MAAQRPRRSLWPPLALLFLLPAASLASSPADADALLTFKSSIVDPQMVLADWGAPDSGPPCIGRRSNWTGVFCGPAGNVIKLVLEGSGLTGRLDLTPLSRLWALRSISFMNNDFEGPMPDIGNFLSLRTLYLSGNRLGGVIPDGAFGRNGAIVKVHLERNGFRGPIPTSLARRARLTELMLQENGFEGGIPEFRQEGLKANFSYNKLEGGVPKTLTNLDASAFMGNKALCGPPLGNLCANTPTETPPAPALLHPPTSPPQKQSSSLLAIVVISIIVLLALLAACFVILRHRRLREQEQLGRPPSLKAKKVGSLKREHHSPARPSDTCSNTSSGGKKAGGSDHGRLVFVREGRERFELQDLLRASAEVLGSGSFGSSYKAVMMNGKAAVVKRFKEMNAVGREDFSEHMRRLGRLSHPNLLPLVAYYYRKEEKLLVFDFIPNGSLAHMLHGSHGPSSPKLDWPARLKIVKGTARALGYLHNELPVLSTPHGHLKSSNVLLRDGHDPLLTDYALAPVTNRSHATQVMVSFKAPEVAQHGGQATSKADVWSLGILILEILTGKFPANFLLQGNEDTDLAEWVSSVVGKEEGVVGEEVFDKEMGGNRHSEGEMLKLLRIGMGCCESDPGKRLELTEALERIEEVREKDGEFEDFSSCISDGSFSVNT